MQMVYNISFVAYSFNSSWIHLHGKTSKREQEYNFIEL